MSETIYLISDTSKKLNVEPHVLRYWEEELDMKIRRNEMGHRYYTEEDIRVLKSVQIMKERGFQLKAIKQLLPKLYEDPQYNWESAMETHEKIIPIEQHRELVKEEKPLTPELKMEQFQEIMTYIVGKALEANNRSLTSSISNEVSDKVSDRVIKQMDYCMREYEEQQEERFRKLDETLRQKQKANAEAAAALESGKRKKKKKGFLF